MKVTVREKASIVMATARRCGQKFIGAHHGGNLRILWWTQLVTEAIYSWKKKPLGRGFSPGSKHSDMRVHQGHGEELLVYLKEDLTNH